MSLLLTLVLAGGQWGPTVVDGVPLWRSSTSAMHGATMGETAWADVDGIHALVMTGDTWFVVGDGETVHALPAEAFTVEAWVQIDAPQEWGGIVSALQDNGSFEKGWMLGYRKDRFAFAVSTEGYGDADGTMTYLVAPEPFTPGAWHHVAGTWDGETQKLYVDGVLVAEDATQEGAVRWPATAPFSFGAYRDKDEHYCMRGLLGPVVIHDTPRDADMADLASRPVREPATSLVELTFPGPDVRRFEANRVPGEDVQRILRLPWNTPASVTVDADLLVRVDAAGADGGLLSALSDEAGQVAGWSLGLNGGVPSLRVWRSGGAQDIRAAAPIEPGEWTFITVGADATTASLQVNGVRRMERSLLGPLRSASHRHLVLAGRRADTTDGTLAVEVAAVNVFAGRRTHAAVEVAAAKALAVLPPPPAVDAGPIVRTLGDGRWSVEWITGDDDQALLEWSINDEPLTLERAHEDGRWRRVVVQTPRVPVGADDAQLRVRVLSRTAWGAMRTGPIHVVDLGTDLSGAGRGYVLYLNPTDDAPLDRAAIGDVQVTIAMDDPARVQAYRRAARDRGIGGDRFAVHRTTLDTLPYAPWLFNEVHVGEIDSQRIVELNVPNLVRPEGGLLQGMTGELDGFAPADGGGLIRTGMPGSRWWSRQYADPGHTSCSQDDLVKGNLHVLWWGRPGPRPMLDRGARAPSPLASHGRMFIQGDHAIFCVDAYNGSPRWTLSMPDLRRTNVPRDTSNMAIGPDGDLHLAVLDDLWVIDGETGAVERLLHTGSAARDWGLVDPLSDGGQLCTQVPREAMYTGAEGQWYDSGGEESWRVGCDRLARLDAAGDEVWAFEPEGWLIHSTIARNGNSVLFVEVPPVELKTQGLLPQSALTHQELVAIDPLTGEEQWRRPLAIGHFDRMTYVLLTNDTALVCGSSDRFHTLAFNAVTGEPRWSKDHAWSRDHHGGPLQHPVIVGDIVYVERCAYDMVSGELLREDIPQGRGCGTKSASNHLLAFRHHFHSFWDPENNEWQEWTGTRGGCWLGLLPAGGMLLGPETSSGCSCTHAIQTSIAWIPVSLDPQLRELAK